MPLYLVTFGYQSAAELAAARRARGPRSIETTGGDDESSAQVLIEAPDQAAAEQWGEQVALGFVGELLRDEFPGWARHPYAVFAEPVDTSEPTPHTPLVAVGEHPSYETWVRAVERPTA